MGLDNRTHSCIMVSMMRDERDSEMKIVNIVKSHDFPGRGDCYFVGEVIDLMDYGFKAKTIKVVRGGTAREIVMGQNDYFTAPFNGNSFMDDFTPGFDRVQVVG